MSEENKAALAMFVGVVVLVLIVIGVPIVGAIINK